MLPRPGAPASTYSVVRPTASSCSATQRAHSASPLVVSGSPVLDVSKRMSALTRSTTSASALEGGVTVTIRTIEGAVGFGSGRADPIALAAHKLVRVAEWQTR